MKMDYVEIVFSVLTFAEMFWTSASGSCSVPTNLLNPVSLQGKITYDATSRHDNCSWILPRVNDGKYVLLIYLGDIQMVYNDISVEGCSGKLILPEITSFCEMPNRRCNIYSTPESSCTFANVSAIANNVSTTCSTTLWHRVQTLPLTIRVEATHPDKKTFSLLYKFISCESIKSKGISTFKKKESTVDMGNRTSVPASSNSSEGPLIAVSVALAVVVVLAVLYLSYKKLLPRRKQRGETPRETSQEFISGSNMESNQQNSRMDLAFNGNIETNEYAEIPTDGFRSDSRQLVANTLYS